MSRDRIHLCEGFTLDLGRGCLLRGGEEVHLRPQTYEVLKYLAEHRGRLISKDQLIEEVWRGRAVTDNSLSKCIEEVREALGVDVRQYLKNVRGRGYLFDPPDGSWSEQVNVFEEENAKKNVAAPTASIPVVEAVTPPAPLEERRVLVPATDWRRALPLLAAGLLVSLAAVAYYLTRHNTAKPANADGVKSLAVLPFKPLVPAGREEALEVGMAETLIAKLSKIHEITVRPLSSVRRYGGLEQDPFAAGRELGVEAVLDGTIQRSGDRVRVTARLIRVGDERQLWEGHFEAAFTDIFSLQDSVSEKVAAALKSRLSSAEESRLAKHYTQNVEAYQLYLRGRYHALKRTLPEAQKAISYFQQAIDLDPSYALAYAGLADAHLSMLAADLPSAEFLPKAKEAAEKAVQLDDALAEAHAELGFVIFWWDWDWGAAEKEFKRALELDPNYAEAHLFYAHLLSNTENLFEISNWRSQIPDEKQNRK